MNFYEIFRFRLLFCIFHIRPISPSCLLLSPSSPSLSLLSPHLSPAFISAYDSSLGAQWRDPWVIDRLALDWARSTLHVQYFLITLYTLLLEVGPRRTSGSWTGAPLRGGEEGENGPTERARRGNCAPTSGSPVAPSRTCRLFPRRDSRSPHLSSVRPASPKPPLFSPLRLWPSHHRRHTCAPRVQGRGPSMLIYF